MAVTTKKGQPITASRSQMQPRPPVRTDAAHTSNDAERQIMQPPAPFANPYGVVNVPAPTNQNFQKEQTAGLPSSKRYGTPKGGYNVSSASILNGTSLTADEAAAIGYSKDATKSSNPVISGFPTGGRKR